MFWAPLTDGMRLPNMTTVVFWWSLWRLLIILASKSLGESSAGTFWLSALDRQSREESLHFVQQGPLIDGRGISPQLFSCFETFCTHVPQSNCTEDTLTMARFQKIILTLSLASHCHANANGNGLIGYGKYMYYPLCAASCRGVIEGSALTCTPHTVEEGGGHSHGSTPPECHATDLPFMQTLALCISQRCSDEYTADILETYWRRHEVNGGRPMLEPRPSLSYANALESIKEMPTEVYIAGEMLNKTSVISDYDWQSQWNALGLFEEVETGHQTLRYQNSH